MDWIYKEGNKDLFTVAVSIITTKAIMNLTKIKRFYWDITVSFLIFSFDWLKRLNNRNTEEKTMRKLFIIFPFVSPQGIFNVCT